MKILFKIIVLAVVAIIAFSKYTSKEGQSKDLLLMNVEALASFEGGNSTYCLGSGSVDCPIDKVKVYKVMENR